MKRLTANIHRGALLLLLAVVWASTAVDTLPVFAQKTASKNDAPAFVLNISKRLDKRNQALYDSIVKRESTADVRLAQVQPSRFLLVNSRISIDLFQGGSVVATRKAITVINDNSFTWHGVSEKGADVLITVYNGEYSATIMREDKFIYALQSLGNDVYAFIKTDQSKERKGICGIDDQKIKNDKKSSTDKSLTDDANGDILIEKQGKGAIVKSSLDGCNPRQIDVLVAYTQGFLSSKSIADIYNANAVANAAFANSGVNMNLRIVGTVFTNYQRDVAEGTGRDIESVDLANFANPSDGYMDEIHPLRDAYQADVCVLASANAGGFYGVAMPDAIFGSFTPSSGFCAVSSLGFEVASNLVYAHEIGHLAGLGHENNLSFRTYGKGYVQPGIFATVMVSGLYINSTPRIPYYSDPYSIPPRGVVGVNEDARAYNEDGPTLGGYRQSRFVQVLGPSSLNVGQRGTWTTSFCGITGVSYRWFLLSNDPMSNGWYQVGSNSPSYSTTMRNYDQFIQLRVEITTSTGEVLVQYQYVSCNNCTGGGAWSVSKDIVGESESSSTQDIITYAERKSVRVEEPNQLISTAQVFPNPASQKITLRYGISRQSTLDVEIVNTAQQRVFKQHISNVRAGDNEITIDISTLPQGTYSAMVLCGGEVRDVPFHLIR
jgi:hypothetical protein